MAPSLWPHRTPPHRLELTWPTTNRCRASTSSLSSTARPRARRERGALSRPRAASARGDRLVVFNGRGTEREASVEALQRRGAQLALGAVRTPCRIATRADFGAGAGEIRRDGSDRAEGHGARRARTRARLHGIQRREARHRAQRAARRPLAQDCAQRVRAMRPARLRASSRRVCWPTALAALPAALKRVALEPLRAQPRRASAAGTGLA